jgi:hypothetical protein
MKRNMPELAAIPIVVVVLVVVFLILWAADAGLGVFLVVGAIGLAAIVVAAVVAMRRPRGTFSGGAAEGVARTSEPVDDGIHRVLLVSEGDYSADELKGLAKDGGTKTRVFVVAPAISSRLARWTGDESAYTEADEHLRSTVRALKELGFDATGQVGAHDPLQAADEALPEFPADEIVFALRGRDETEWLESGVVDAARTRYAVTVRELES